MSTWDMILIIINSLLLVFICRKEMLRPNKARLALRIAASIIAVIGLACMGLGLTMIKSKSAAVSEIIVVTEGADPDSVQYFKNHKEIPVLPAEDFLAAQAAHYDSVHVFGPGFSEDELKSIDHTNIIFHSTPISSGITSVNWNPKIKKGDELLVQGIYTNTTSLPVTLLLSGFTAVIDSFVVPANKTGTFQLHAIPKQNGKAVYTLFALQGKDTLEKEPLPIEVLQPQPVKVLILAASPGFENRFLKDWLSQNGYTVVTRTTISTNKTDRSVFNATAVSLDHLTPSLLDSFDIVLSDETALSSLNQPEQEAIYKQVSEKGMGLILQTDTITTPGAWYTRSFHLYALPGKQPSELSLSLRQDDQNKIKLPVDQPQFIRLQKGMQAWVTDSAGNTVAGSIAAGAGKILLTTLNNTYHWLLAGNATAYYSLWNRLLQKTARQNVPAVTVEISPALPVAEHPVSVGLKTLRDTLPFVLVGQVHPAFAQDEKIAYQWQSVYWPSKPGWQSPVTIEDVAYNWYVYDPHDWTWVSAKERMDATGSYLTKQKSDTNNLQEANEPSRVPITLVYFFLPFIICCGFLWIERKIS